MGANAQTSVPTFTAGQVLTAAQLNESARTGVPVAADASARDGLFGGTGEKTLAEGQLVYLEDSDVVQYYDGSVWATLGPAAAGALTLVSTTTIGSGVSDVTVSNAFSSTYDNYKIVVSGGTASATNTLQIQLGTTTSGYYTSLWGYTFAGANSVYAEANSGSWVCGIHSVNNLCVNIDLFGPNLAKQTTFMGLQVTDITTGNARATGGYQASSTQFTSIKFITTGGATLTGGTIRVYGYQNS